MRCGCVTAAATDGIVFIAPGWSGAAAGPEMRMISSPFSARLSVTRGTLRTGLCSAVTTCSTLPNHKCPRRTE